MTIEELRHHVATYLTEIEGDLLPRNKWRLSLVARYVGPDHESLDSDIIITADKMPTLLACVQRRAGAESNEKDQPTETAAP